MWYSEPSNLPYFPIINVFIVYKILSINVFNVYFTFFFFLGVSRYGKHQVYLFLIMLKIHLLQFELWQKEIDVFGDVQLILATVSH
jgi:hypothetical protein